MLADIRPSACTRARLALGSLLLPFLGFFVAVPHASAAFETYHAFRGGSFTINYVPEGTQCKDGLKGKVTIGSFEVPSADIRYWNVCRGDLQVGVPDSAPADGEVVVMMPDGHSYEVGELVVYRDPVISRVTRQVTLTSGVPTSTRFIVDGSDFGAKFYVDTLFLGSRGISVAETFNGGEIVFVVDGTVPDTDLVSVRAGAEYKEAGYSNFTIEPSFVSPVVPTIVMVSDFKLSAGSDLTIFGYGLMGPGGEGPSKYAVHVSIGDAAIPDGNIRYWNGNRLDIVTPAMLDAEGPVRITLARLDGGAPLVMTGPVVGVHPSYANDPRIDDQDYLKRTGVDAAWRYTKGSDEVVVAVIDDGVDTNNPDITDNIWFNKGELPGNGVDDDGNGYVDDVHGYDFYGDKAELTPYGEHGTAVASIIGATGNNGIGIAGINWHVRIMPVIAIGPNGGSHQILAKAIKYAADNGADVINMSLGGQGWTNDYDESLTPAIQYAYDRGVVIVAAAGNGDMIDGQGVNLDVNLNSPVCNDGDKNMVIGVGSVGLGNLKSDFSDYGKCIDLMAPGEHVLVLGAFGSIEDSAVYASGTSFAAPIVSGIAALLKAENPKLTNGEIRQALMDTAHPVGMKTISGISTTGPSRLGAGLVDAGAALSRVAPQPAEVPVVASPAAPAVTSQPETRTVDPTSSGSVDKSLVARVAGRILLQVQSVGEAWYVHPDTGLRYYMKDGATAYEMMRNFGLGITNGDLDTIPSVESTAAMKASVSACAPNSVATRVKGKILLQVQSVGEAWYVDPDKCRRIYMKDGAAAYGIMRYLGLGITNTDLDQLVVGD